MTEEYIKARIVMLKHQKAVETTPFIANGLAKEIKELQYELDKIQRSMEVPDPRVLLNKPVEREPWSIKDGMIYIPDEYEPLFNSFSLQLKFHTHSGKDAVMSVAHMIQKAEEFFKKKYSQ